MSKESKRKHHFGFARAFVVIWLGVVGLSLIFIGPSDFLGVIFILAMLYVIFMDTINGLLPGRDSKNSDPASKQESATADVYDPSAHGKPIKCPYCGKKIPSDISFCYYCGKSLETFKKIESVRTGSMNKIDEALSSINDGATKEHIRSIRENTAKIILKLEEKPDSKNSHSKKFLDYYLPKTVSAIEHYSTLCALDDLDPDQLKIKGYFEESLEDIDEAFANIFNRISTEGLYDTSADVSVLETILKQDGLTEPDFKL